MRNTEEGFSLIEFLIYVIIASIILGVVFTLHMSIIQARLKNQAIAEGEQQGQQVLQQIAQAIRNAASLNAPGIGLTGSSLSLNTYSSSTSPTIFLTSGGVVTMQEGTGAPAALNSTQIVISNLLFQNLSRVSNHATIRFSYTSTYNNPTNRTQNNFSKNFYGSAEIRGIYP